jgi:two-component system, OmpR family, alkaline phosphatase synthesis response regulator PhoP
VCATSPTEATRIGQLPSSILCVDDSEEILLICRTMLEAGGYQVFTANSGQKALELLHRHAIDAAVIDNLMPGMSGLELAREIKRLGNGIPVIMFSSTGQPDESFPFVDSYVSKGQGPRALRNRLGLLLRK